MYLYSLCVVPGIKSMALYMQDKCYKTELPPWPKFESECFARVCVCVGGGSDCEYIF